MVVPLKYARFAKIQFLEHSAMKHHRRKKRYFKRAQGRWETQKMKNKYSERLMQTASQFP